MTFDPQQVTTQINQAMGGMLLLNSSCQALIEVSIAPSSSPWYPVLDQELGEVENLVVGWRQNGFLYFQQDILAQIASCGNDFLSAQPALDALFVQLEQAFDPGVQAQIVAGLTALEAPVNGMIGQIDAYNGQLAQFQKALEGPAAQMRTTVAEVQAQETQIAAQITAINAQIVLLQAQVTTDRQAIAQAESQRTDGIIETIFGVLLTPFTGGASLILAGIGVASIAEAQAKIDDLQSEISNFQQQIVSEQQDLSSDEQQVATLQGLILSVSLAVQDTADLATALDGLRDSWSTLGGEIAGAATDVQNAQNAQEAIVAKTFFDAACIAWSNILTSCGPLSGLPAPTPNMVQIGS